MKDSYSSNKSWLIILPLIIFIALTILFLFGLSSDPSKLSSALKGKPLPEFSLPRLLSESGEIMTHKSMSSDWFVFNVWATWCSTCWVEHAFLLKLQNKGVPLYGLNYKDDHASALSYIKKKGNPYVATIVDDSGRLGIDLGIYGLPETFLVDQNKVIRFRYAGELNESVWQKDFLPIIEEMKL